MITDDPYAVLGVARDCDGDSLKIAYRRLVREHHPDMATDKASATQRMTQINAAWSLVGDPQKRADFDLRQRFEERRHRERITPRAVPSSSRASSASSSSPSRASASSSTGAASSNDKRASSASAPARPAPATSRHARLAEASRLLFKQNQPAEALELCRAVLKTDFRNIPARELMGEAYLRLGELERALAVWEQALVLSPGNAPLRRRWMQLMSPDVRSQPFAASRPAPPPPLPAKVPRPKKKKSPGLFSRLIGRLKRR